MGVMDKLRGRRDLLVPLFGGEKDPGGYKPVSQADPLRQAATQASVREIKRGS